MALTRNYSKYAGKGCSNAPKGSTALKGKGPGTSGHSVGGKGTKNAPKSGAVRGSSPSNSSPSRRGSGGTRSSSAGNYGKAGNY